MSYIGNSPTQGAITGGNIVDGSIESIDLATLTNIDINSGSIDGTIIGASSAAAGTFTSLVANSNVGIGTASPSQKLTVTGNAYVGTGNYFTDNTSGYFFSGNGSYDAGLYATGTSLTTLKAQNNLSFVTNGAERMRIDASGAVSIKQASDTNVYLSLDGTANSYFNMNTTNGYILSGSNTIFNTAGSERMRIDSSGNVGIGTSSPSSFNGGGHRLVVGNGANFQGMSIYSAVEGNIYFADGTSGTESYAGSLGYNHSSNFLYMYTNGSERARIDSSGNLLVGKTSTNIAGDGVVLGTGSQSFTGTGGQYSYRITTNGGVGLHHFYSDVGGTQTLKSYVGTDGNYVQLSDYRLKENITPIENAVDKVNKLKPVTYTWKNTEGKEAHGFIAHEFKEVLPNEVDGDKDQVKEDGTPFYQAINVSSAIPLLVKAMQEQQEIIESLKTRIETLENK